MEMNASNVKTIALSAGEILTTMASVDNVLKTTIWTRKESATSVTPVLSTTSSMLVPVTSATRIV